MLKSKRFLSMTLALLMITGLFPMLSFPALAADEAIVAALYDDSGGWVDFGGINDIATIGFNGKDEKDYNMTITLTFPSDAQNKSATIKLAEGVKFRDDGSAALLAQGEWLTGAVVNAPNAAPFSLPTEMPDTGSKTYDFFNSVQAVTIKLTVRADSRFWFDSIKNAITVTMNCGGSMQAEEVLEELKVSCPTRRAHSGNGIYSGYVSVDSETVISPGSRAFLVSLTSAWEICPVFFKEFEATITIDSHVTVTNTDPDNWGMTAVSSGGQTTYTFQYQDVPGLLTSLAIPVSFTFPSAHFAEGATVSAARSATAILAGESGGRVTNWGPIAMTFRIANGEVKLFVNYDTIAAAQKPDAPAGADTSASSGTTGSAFSGVVGWYTIGNGGGLPSDRQTIELHFDAEKLGVLALTLPIPTGQKVSEIDYKTVNSPEWQTKVLAAPLVGAGNYASISWAGLGIIGNPMATGNYITAIRFSLDSIPDTSVLGMSSAPTFRNAIYGVTLPAGIGETATSTVSLYSPDDADDESEWITGNIFSNHSESYAAFAIFGVGGIPGVDASVSKPAGETFSFSQKIAIYNSSGLNWVSNSLRNNAVAHPIIYLRSESGNPITNIKIVNSRGTNITGYLDITSEQEDEVLVYKIDTSHVPGDGAAIAHTLVNAAGGTVNNCSLTLSYDIPTKPTDGGIYQYVDMIFVETPRATPPHPAG